MACATSPRGGPPAAAVAEEPASSASPALVCGMDAAPNLSTWAAQLDAPPEAVVWSSEPMGSAGRHAGLVTADVRWEMDQIYVVDEHGEPIMDMLLVTRTTKLADGADEERIYILEEPGDWNASEIARAIEQGAHGPPGTTTITWSNADGSTRRKVSETENGVNKEEWLVPRPPFDAIIRRTGTREGRVVRDECTVIMSETTPTPLIRECVASRCPGASETQPPPGAECTVIEYDAPSWVPRVPVGARNPRDFGVSRIVRPSGEEKRFEWRQKDHGAEVVELRCPSAQAPRIQCDVNGTLRIAFDGRLLVASKRGVVTSYCYER